MIGWRAIGVAGVSVAAAMGLSSIVSASAFQPSDLAVERVGGDASFGGAASSSSAATAVFVDEFGKSGLQATPVQTIALPTTASGGNAALTDSGSATSNGYLTRSTNGSVLVLPGYNTAVGTTGVAGSNPATINRVIGLVDGSGTVDTTRGFTDGPSNNYRSVASDNGTQYWLSTAGNSPRYYGGTGVTTTTALASVNSRSFTIFGGHLLFSSMSGAFVGINDLGGLPTSGTATPTNIADATSGTGTPSPYGIQLFDLDANNFNGTGADTMYVADDRSLANGGGLQKWHYDGTSWTLQYTLSAGLTSNGLRGLTGELVAGVPTLYVTSVQSATGTSNNSLLAISDTGAGSSFTDLADSPSNTFFRGVALSPTGGVPEPASLGLLSAGGLFLAARRRRS